MTKRDKGIVDIDKNTLEAVLSVQNKGHVLYIRYLLSKKVPPTTIQKELGRLSLSSPDRSTLGIYFQHFMHPIISECGLEKYYSNYLKRLTGKGADKETTPTLNFDVTFKNNDADRIAFCKFIRALDIEDMWSREVVRYYGGIHNLPQNEHGERIIKVVQTRNVENILTSPRKYVIDKLLLEDISASRIEAYMMDEYQIKLNQADISAYARYFFNFERRNIETLLEQLISERNSVESDLEIMYNNDKLTLGDKASTAAQYEQKIKFLDSAISDLNTRYSELSYKQGINEQLDLEYIVEDMIRCGYKRFKMLDSAKDRDVVKPITDISKMVFTAIDKKHQMEDHKAKASNRSAIDRDKNAGEVLLELYQEAYDTSIKKMEKKSAVGEEVQLEDIEGINEV